MSKCQADGCPGEYIKRTVYYINLRLVRTPQYQISVEDYEELTTKEKRTYNAVVSSCCNICNDDYEARLISFIKENY